MMRSACQGSGSNIAGVAQGSIGCKEMHYVLRVLGPAACRCPELFADVAKESLRVALPHPSPNTSRIGKLGIALSHVCDSMYFTNSIKITLITVCRKLHSGRCELARTIRH